MREPMLIDSAPSIFVDYQVGMNSSIFIQLPAVPESPTFEPD